MQVKYYKSDLWFIVNSILRLSLFHKSQTGNNNCGDKMSKIQKGDRVIVLSGADRGKEGIVLKVVPSKGRAIVEGINFVKHHQKPTQRSPQGGIVEKESPVHMSNLMVIDPKTNQATKTKMVKLQDGRKVRVSKISGEMITSTS